MGTVTAVFFVVPRLRSFVSCRVVSCRRVAIHRHKPSPVTDAAAVTYLLTLYLSLIVLLMQYFLGPMATLKPGRGVKLTRSL